MNCRVWLRLGHELPNGELASLAESFPGVEFTDREPEASGDIIDVVFTNRIIADDIVARMPGLAWIHTSFGGGEPYRTQIVIDRGIVVTSSRGVQAAPLAEFTEACVFALAKKFPTLMRKKQSHQWDETLRLDRLEGRIAVFLGLGAVSQVVARRLHDRGLRNRVIRRRLEDVPPFIATVSGWDRLTELLSEADFLIIGLPGMSEFRGRLGNSELRAMKPTSYIINLVTRGIICDEILFQALEEKWIAGAACNVFEHNPLPPESPLWGAPNLIISPNIAHSDPARWNKLREVFIDNLGRYLTGVPLINVVGGAESH